ncbi:DUF2231 domain-containing protein [Cryptosporangium sp. NPDC051539]|uniref:DUF2231 domain-containing protein n=1 Tax=Cryptosporangium sp. NPDC051539 TaxID=3363962 RepID=UPI0037A24EF1
MFDLVNGLPVHPLVVHAVVVLLPLAVLGAVAIAVVPRWRVRFGVLVLAVTVAATVSIPLATESGEALEHRVGDPGRHAALGDQLIWFALPLLVLVAAMVWLARRDQRSGGGAMRGAATAVAVLAVVVGLANVVQVYRIGDSGARAAWGDQVATGPK